MMNGATRPGVLTSLGLSCLTVGLLSCSASEPQDSQSKIYGGVKTKAGEWLSTVALVSNGRMFCTGTAISPKVIITAAHCIQGSNPSRIGVYVGEGNEGGRVTAQYTAVKLNYSPKYSRDIEGWNDIAYLVLDKPLDLPEMAYIPVLTDADETDAVLQTGLDSYLVGFGNRDGGGFGVKFEVDVAITKVGDNEVALGNNGKDSCQGDSGGPAFVKLKNGDWRVFGVVSRGGACGTGGIYGRMNANICWIQEDSGVDLGFADYCEPSKQQEPKTPEDPKDPEA
ncbi:MAG TPA: trypsin-like serine protease [Oligoflexus sp.]|uniref:S1 family peptidase n=1 Tax=Oligoflexus sp. TaxID=1971216 RepID=UPI002D2309FA|nr:trypsin-like serine protease [Oligoflexus sp.]HYX38136.1 trypsin-like serine protease [Oligoflexus sp.]